MVQPASKRLVTEVRLTDIVNTSAAAAASSTLAGAKSDLDAAAASAAASAKSAQDSAAAATAPTDTAVANAVNGTTTQTRTALEANFATAGKDVRPWAQGVADNYTGTFGYGPAPESDSRAGIQAALNGAQDNRWSTAYPSRRTRTVKLPTGHYYITAKSDGTPSLVVPTGVTFDASDATLFFKYPATATTSWSGIKVEGNGKLKVGRMLPAPGVNPAPDAAKVYDAIRVVDADNTGSPVSGMGGDSTISGFQGAGVRLIGAWVNRISGIEMYGMPFGVVNSIHQATSAADGYGYGGKAYNGSVRMPTEVWLTDCNFHDLTGPAFLGTVGGGTADPNAIDTSFRSPGLYFQNCLIENISGQLGLNAVNYDLVSMSDCGIEEVGNTTSSLRFELVRSLHIKNLRYYIQGRNGAATTPPAIFDIVNVDSFTLAGLGVLNAFVTGLTLASNAAATFDVKGVSVVTTGWPNVRDMAAGPMFRSDSITIPAQQATAVIGTPPLGALGSLTPGFQLDPAIAQSVSFLVNVPSSWRTFDVAVVGANPSAGVGGVVLRAILGGVNVGANIGSGLTTTDCGLVTTTAGTQFIAQKITLGAGKNVPAGSPTLIRVDRVAADAGDTLANAWTLVALVVTRKS